MLDGSFRGLEDFALCFEHLFSMGNRAYEQLNLNYGEEAQDAVKQRDETL